MMYLLTAIGFSPGGGSTVHIYTQTKHRTTHWDEIHRTYVTIKYIIYKIKQKLTKHTTINIMIENAVKRI
jgi:hypothetical protein